MSNTQTNDLQSVADEILDNAIAAAPFTARIDELKEVMSAATTTAGLALRFSSAKGMVETRKGSTGASKGFVAQFDPQRYELLPEKKRAELVKLGVVTIVEVFGKVSKPAVTIKPILANDNQAEVAA